MQVQRTLRDSATDARAGLSTVRTAGAGVVAVACLVTISARTYVLVNVLVCDCEVEGVGGDAGGASANCLPVVP